MENKRREVQKDESAARSRRTVVKSLVGGVAAFAAYHVLPTNWSKPVIEQIVVPAHAATSGVTLHDPCTVTYLESVDPGNDAFNVFGYVSPPTAGLTVNVSITSSITATSTTVDTNTGTTTTQADGTFSLDITVGSALGAADRVDTTTTVTGADGSANCFSIRPPED
ncbi:hypothetical protein [Desulforhopalus singaporensis]|uniref:Uncharacterized protein n=1 Tax=Desulforhopalus singaporensis TaxID=91360 RepID=A0A1H0SIP6_9BACT|nr:hypothetical protein [Desulforhopalus singaporensis]SDP41634.1 hypothetical protein SAMN05660330_02696 [Desulforhopalus singaporensis]